MFVKESEPNAIADLSLTSSQHKEGLDKALEVIQQTVDEARRVVADLRPTVLDDFGLAAALRLQAQRLSDEGIRASYKEALGGERLPEVVETALFRVAQEALTNVRKHALTDRVHITLERRGQAICLQIQDWGRGFVPTTMTSGGNPGEEIGLSSMRERVALLGGHFEIHSELGTGTVIVVEVPWREETGPEVGVHHDTEAGVHYGK